METILPGSGRMLARIWPDSCQILPESGQILTRSCQHLARFWPDPASIIPECGQNRTRIWPDPGQILARNLTETAQEFRGPSHRNHTGIAQDSDRDRTGMTDISREISQKWQSNLAESTVRIANRHRNSETSPQSANAPHMKLK